MDYLQILFNAIENMINEMREMRENNFDDKLYPKGTIVSNNGKKASGNRYPFGPINLFETSLVEKVIRNILLITNREYKNNDEKIGWEVSYPNDLKEWSRSKLDIGIELIEKDNKGNEIKESNLFKIAIEVKKWFPSKNIPYYIWSDIFKIMGYSKPNSEVGKNKFLLIFWDASENNIAESKIQEHFTNYLIKENKNTKELLENFINTTLSWNQKGTKDVIEKLIDFKNISELIKEEKIFIGHGISALLLRVNSRNLM